MEVLTLPGDGKKEPGHEGKPTGPTVPEEKAKCSADKPALEELAPSDQRQKSNNNNNNTGPGSISVPVPTRLLNCVTQTLVDSHHTTTIVKINSSTINSPKSHFTTPKGLLNRLTNRAQDTLLQAAMNNRPSGRGKSSFLHPHMNTYHLSSKLTSYPLKDPSGSRPVYSKPRGQNVIDLDKFETEPLPRERVGFQPRGQKLQAEGTSVVSSIATKPPSLASPREVLGGEANMQSCCADELATTTNSSEIGRPSESSGSAATVQASQVAPSVGKANLASGQIQSSVKSGADSKSKVGAAGMWTVLMVADAHQKVEATKSGTRTQQLAAGRAVIQQSAQARVGAITRSTSQAPGLDSSMWAPKQQTLRDLPGLRQTRTWDDSGFYTRTVHPGSRLNLNVLPEHAWNGGVKPQPSNSTFSERVPKTQQGLIHAEGAKTTKSMQQVLTKTPQKSELLNAAGDNSSKEHYVPPHLRIAEPKTQPLEPNKETKPANKMGSSTANSVDPAEHRGYQVESPSTIVPSSPFAESSPYGLSQENPEASMYDTRSLSPVSTMTSTAIAVEQKHTDLNDSERKLAPHLRVPKSQASLALTESQSHIQDKLNAQDVTKVDTKEGFKKTGVNGVSKFVSPTSNGKAAKDQKNTAMGWDSEPAEHPGDWESRSRHPIPAKEQMQALKSWARASESAFHEASTYVDTALPEFTRGTGVIHDGSLSTGLAEEAHFTRRLPNDPLTLARAEQTAQSKIEERNAMKQEEPTVAPLTKQEQRQLRRALRQQEEESANTPNPYKPKADIYIRPAQPRDLPQIAEIYNHYVETSAVALELDTLNQDAWRSRMVDCRGEGYDMYVAVQKSAKGNGRNRRDNCEPIYGFAYAEDQNDKRSSCRFSARAQVYVSWMHLRIGVGRCLLDRVMAMLNVNHHHKQGVDWVGEAPSVQREVKKVLIEIPYWDDSEEERAIFKMEKNEITGQMDRVPGWKAKMLENVQFEYAMTLKEIGFKKAILDKGKT